MGKELVVLCDSNIVIRLFRGDKSVEQALRKVGKANLALSIVTHAEVYIGTKKGKMKATRKILEGFN